MFSKRTKINLKQRLCKGYVFGGGGGGEGGRLYSMDPISYTFLHGFVHVLANLHFLCETSTRHEDSCFPGEFVCLRSNRLRAVSCFSLQSYCTRNLSTQAAKPGAARKENNVVLCNRAR